MSHNQRFEAVVAKQVGNPAVQEEVLALYAAAIARAEQAERELRRLTDERHREALQVAGHHIGECECEMCDMANTLSVLTAERDEWKQRAEVADAELLRMHDAVGGLASGLPKHIAALVAERDALAAELAAVREALEHIIADMPDHLVHPQAVCDAIRQAIARTPSAP